MSVQTGIFSRLDRQPTKDDRMLARPAKVEAENAMIR